MLQTNHKPFTYLRKNTRPRRRQHRYHASILRSQMPKRHSTPHKQCRAIYSHCLRHMQNGINANLNVELRHCGCDGCGNVFGFQYLVVFEFEPGGLVATYLADFKDCGGTVEERVAAA